VLRWLGYVAVLGVLGVLVCGSDWAAGAASERGRSGDHCKNNDHAEPATGRHANSDEVNEPIRSAAHRFGVRVRPRAATEQPTGGPPPEGRAA
jgi:hypothetical protein